MEIPPPADSPEADSSVPRDASEKPAIAVPKKATATQFFLKGLAIVLPPILTLVILVWISQMIYGYVVNPITTGVRFVIAEIIDKSRPTSELVPATGLPPLEYCGNDYRIPAGAARESAPRPTRHAAGPSPRTDQNRWNWPPLPNWPLSPTSPLENGQFPTATSRKLRHACDRPIGRRRRPGFTWSSSQSGISRAWAR